MERPLNTEAENDTLDLTEEVQAAETVPEQEATAAPDTDDAAPGDNESPPKTFTQEELDEIVARRVAKAERAMRREQQPKPVIPEAYDGDGVPLSPEEIIRKHEQAKQGETLREAYFEREEAALEKYDDFQQVAYNPSLPVSETMARAIQASDDGPDVLYWLGSNPKEATRISRIADPVLQAKEIGKIEARLADNPPAPRTSKAPAPLAPVTPSSNGKTVYDTTDPRSIDTMSTSQWIEADRQRQLKKLEAKRR